MAFGTAKRQKGSGGHGFKYSEGRTCVGVYNFLEKGAIGVFFNFLTCQVNGFAGIEKMGRGKTVYLVSNGFKKARKKATVDPLPLVPAT